jgi:hypothetical protein
MAELLTADLSVALDTIARTVQGWLDDHEKSLKDAEGFQCDITDDFHMIRFPGGEWPSRGMFKNWVSALRAAASSVETKATLPHGFTGLQAFDAYEWLRGVCEKEPDNDHAHVALGLWHHHATGGPVETTVQPDEKCGNCGDDYSKHLGERLICPDAAMPDIYRWTAEPTQVKAAGDL